MRKVIAALIAAAIAFSQQSAIAQTANRDSNNNIIVSGTGLTANTLVQIWYPKAFDTAKITTSGACNLLTIKKSPRLAYSNFVKVNGTQINLSIFQSSSLTAPACLNGVANPAYTWTTVAGYRYVRGEGKVFILTPAAGQFTVQTDVGNFRLGRVDKCGRISIRNSEKWPIAALNFGDGTFSYAVDGQYGPDLLIPTSPSAAMPICYKGILYRPLNP